MEQQSQTKSNYQDNHWLNMAEAASVIASIGGSVASIFFKEIILASAPLSACVALNVINRKRLLNLVTKENDKAIAALTQHNQNERANICDQIMQIQQSNNNLQNQYENVSHQLAELEFASNSNELIQKLQSQNEQTALEVEKLAQIQIYSQPIQDSANSVELYCRNGDGYQQLGEKQKAINEYSQAIKIDSRCAKAY